MLHSCFHFAFQSAWTLRRDEQEIKNHRLSSLFSSHCHCPGASLLKKHPDYLWEKKPLCYCHQTCFCATSYYCACTKICTEPRWWKETFALNQCSSRCQCVDYTLPNSLSHAFLFRCCKLLLCIQCVLQGALSGKALHKTNSQAAAEI